MARSPEVKSVDYLTQRVIEVERQRDFLVGAAKQVIISASNSDGTLCHAITITALCNLQKEITKAGG